MNQVDVTKFLLIDVINFGFTSSYMPGFSFMVAIKKDISDTSPNDHREIQSFKFEHFSLNEEQN